MTQTKETRKQNNKKCFQQCQFGNNAVIVKLLKLGADVNYRNVFNRVPLMEAAERNHFDVCKTLIQHKADVNARSIHGETALFVASKNGHARVVELLLSNGDNPNIPTGINPVALAVHNDGLKLVRLVRLKTHRGRTPWTRVLGSGHCSKVSREIEGDQTLYRMTPLFAASMNGHVTVVRLLLWSGANPNTYTYNELTPLLVACQLGHVEIVEMLIWHNAYVNFVGHYSSALHTASRVGAIDIVNLLLEYGADVDIVDEERRTPLIIASAFGHVQVVQRLLRRNARVDIVATNSFTPLCVASQQGHSEVVRLLLEHGSRVNVTTDQGTPLFLATNYGYEDIVERLLRFGADPNIAVDESPLLAAKTKGRTQIARLLIANGAGVTHFDIVGVIYFWFLTLMLLYAVLIY